MGLFSGGNKKTSATQLTAGAQTQAGDPVSVSISGKANSAYVTNTMTDYGAIGGALIYADNTAARSIGAVKDIANQSLGAAKAISDGSIKFADDSNKRSFDFAEGFGSEVLSFSQSVIDRSLDDKQAVFGLIQSANDNAVRQIADFAESSAATNSSAMSKIADFAKSQSLNNDERITKIALWGVGIVAAVAVGPQLIAAFKG